MSRPENGDQTQKADHIYQNVDPVYAALSKVSLTDIASGSSPIGRVFEQFGAQLEFLLKLDP